MSVFTKGVAFLALARFVGAHSHGEHEIEQVPLVGPTALGGAGEWLEKYGAQGDLGYTGPLSFANLEYARCLEKEDPTFDIAILGMPCAALSQLSSHRRMLTIMFPGLTRRSRIVLALALGRLVSVSAAGGVDPALIRLAGALIRINWQRWLIAAT